MVLLLLLGLCLSQIWSAAVPSTGDNDQVQFLRKARSFPANTELFDYCFDRYTKVLSSENDLYKYHYMSCIEATDMVMVAADNATAKARDEMYEQATCSITKACRELNATVVDELNCLEGRAKSSSNRLKGVSRNAVRTKVKLEQKYQSIIAEREICVLEEQLAFNMRVDYTYDLWEDCLKENSLTPTTQITSDKTEDGGPPTKETTTSPPTTPSTPRVSVSTRNPKC